MAAVMVRSRGARKPNATGGRLVEGPSAQTAGRVRQVP